MSKIPKLAKMGTGGKIILGVNIFLAIAVVSIIFYNHFIGL
ncbi:MAG: hypothetical protein P8J53_03555 [Alphaproteobacteria bacterium]|jgi:hypothetical protein|nr:hypothetical protein [Alphaproteobacteria bacterium]MDB4234070.1 hypothetical protein [Alphaproteobacteria bacterium]MDB9824782.1 hypothetical protein [Alphaproteobacteria bacterium]MDG2007439.1 hypothetical protein [Alphaproteobacteria bacterium]|tara:strand:+ start:1198 stop:1320 length:123 start_codon:yes stop_codon:yes gene_type:complete